MGYLVKLLAQTGLIRSRWSGLRESWTSLNMEVLQHLWATHSGVWPYSWYTFSFLPRILCCNLCLLALVPLWCTYEKRLVPFSSPVLPSGSCKKQEGLIFSKLKICSSISLFTCIMFSSARLFWRHFDWLCSMCQYCSCTGGSLKPVTVPRWGVT